jgi:hypothetical protein
MVCGDWPGWLRFSQALTPLDLSSLALPLLALIHPTAWGEGRRSRKFVKPVAKIRYLRDALVLEKCKSTASRRPVSAREEDEGT